MIRLILPENRPIYTLNELIEYINGKGEFILKKDVGKEAFIVEKR